jgi:hypothetical protein
MKTLTATVKQADSQRLSNNVAESRSHVTQYEPTYQLCKLLYKHTSPVNLQPQYSSVKKCLFLVTVSN